MQGLRAPGPVCACRGGPGRALRAGGPTLHERNPQRSIVRVTGVSRMTVAVRIKKSLGRPAGAAPAAAQKGAEKAVGST